MCIRDRVRGTKFGDEIAAVMTELESMPEKIQRVLDNTDQFHALARRLSDKRSVLFLSLIHI